MRALVAPAAVAAALSLCPQAVAATPLDQAPRAPTTAEPSVLAAPADAGRRVRIILMRDGSPVGGSTEVTGVAPPLSAEAQIEAAPLEPLTPPPAPAPAPMPQPAVAAPWTEDELRTPLAAGAGWRIQVGAFRDAARAEARIAELETTAAGPGADPVRQVVSVQEPGGAIYRAQMSGFIDRTAADAACLRLAATGAACFVIAP